MCDGTARILNTPLHGDQLKKLEDKFKLCRRVIVVCVQKNEPVAGSSLL